MPIIEPRGIAFEPDMPLIPDVVVVDVVVVDVVLVPDMAPWSVDVSDFLLLCLDPKRFPRKDFFFFLPPWSVEEVLSWVEEEELEEALGVVDVSELLGVGVVDGAAGVGVVPGVDLLSVALGVAGVVVVSVFCARVGTAVKAPNTSVAVVK